MDHEKPEVMVTPSIYTSGHTTVQPDVELDDLHERLDDVATHTGSRKQQRDRRGDSLW